MTHAITNIGGQQKFVKSHQLLKKSTRIWNVSKEKKNRTCIETEHRIFNIKTRKLNHVLKIVVSSHVQSKIFIYSLLYASKAMSYIKPASRENNDIYRITS